MLLLLVVMIFGFVASTSAQDAPSGEVTFVFWENTTTARAGWEAHVARFNEIYPDITVNLIGVPGEIWSDYLQGTATLIAGGETPDIIWVATEGVRFLVDLGLMMPLDDLIAQEGDSMQPYFDDIAPALLDSMRVDDKLYFLPFSWNNMVMLYNKNMFDAAGVEYPSNDWTRDDFLAAARALTADRDGDGNNDQFGFSGSGGGLFTTIPWVLANGTSIITDDFCAPNLTDPAVIEAVQFLYDLTYVEKVAPAPGTLTDVGLQFINGDIAMFGGGRWPIIQMFAEGFTDFDIAPWPGNPEQTTIYGVDGFGIFQSSQNPTAAWEFLKFMSSADVQQLLVGTEDSPLGNIPALRSVAEGISPFPPANYGIYYGSLDGNVRLVPSPPRFNELESIFMRYYNQVMADEISVEDAMNAAQTELSTVVTCS
jgi:ABC-type glycerol-3-phosphate transport system substrate-binding protein